MRGNRRIGVIIPALNEEHAIGGVIAAIPRWVDSVVVVDNGSSDATATQARLAGARVVIENERGYGAACLRGLGELRDAEIVVFLDGDHSDDPSEMAWLVDPIASGAASFVVGSRAGAAKAALTPPQRFGNWLACRLMGRIWGTSWSDLGPFRAIRRDALDALDMQDRRFGWTVEMQIKAGAARLTSLEVPVSYRPRPSGVSKISGTFRGSVMAGATILSLIARSAWQPDARPSA